MKTSTPRVRGWSALFALALVLALTGCLKTDVDLSIEGDTVSGTILTAIDRDVAEQAQIDPNQMFAEQTGGLTALEGVSSAPYDEGRWVGSELTLDQVNIDELNQLSANDPDGLQIIRDEEAGTYEFRLVMDLTFMSELNQEDFTAAPGAPDVDLEALLEAFEASIAVTFPGEVTDHNGDDLSGSTVTWQPEPGERNELRAVGLGAAGGGEGEPGGSGDPGDAGDGATAGPGGGTGEEAAEPGIEPVSGDQSTPTALLVALAALIAMAAAAAGGWLLWRRSQANRGEPATEPAPTSGTAPTSELPAQE